MFNSGHSRGYRFLKKRFQRMYFFNEKVHFVEITSVYFSCKVYFNQTNNIHKHVIGVVTWSKALVSKPNIAGSITARSAPRLPFPSILGRKV